MKERTPFRLFLFAHWPCLVRSLCKAVLDALSLRLWVNGQVDDLAFRSSLPGEPSQRGPFVFAPQSPHPGSPWYEAEERAKLSRSDYLPGYLVPSPRFF